MAGERWSRALLPVPESACTPGLHVVELEWPALERQTPSEYERALERLEQGYEARFVAAFGEVHASSALVLGSPHDAGISSSPRPTSPRADGECEVR